MNAYPLITWTFVLGVVGAIVALAALLKQKFDEATQSTNAGGSWIRSKRLWAITLAISLTLIALSAAILRQQKF